jgi:hypothetical protein
MRMTWLADLALAWAPAQKGSEKTKKESKTAHRRETKGELFRVCAYFIVYCFKK